MRDLPPLAALRAFEAAARHLSFKRAAEEFGVTPTAVSHQVRLLEQICGCSLFRRRPRPLRLTAAGERLYPGVRRGFEALAAAMAALDDCERRPLRVTSTNAFASRWLVPRLPLWRAVHKDLPLEVIGTDKPLDLEGGEADLAIRYAANSPAGLAGTELLRDRFVPVCRRDLIVAPLSHPRDLLAFPLIHFEWARPDPAPPTWARWLAAAREIDPGLPELPDSWALSFREEMHAIEAVLDGQGIAICSDVILGRELERGELVRAHPLSLPGFGFFLVHAPSHSRQEEIAAFAGWMRACISAGAQASRQQ